MPTATRPCKGRPPSWSLLFGEAAAGARLEPDAGQRRGRDAPCFGAGPLAYLGAGRDSLAVTAAPDTCFMLLGGEPFEEDILMWWNFVGRTHEEIVEAREDWEAQASLADPDARAARFGVVDGHGPDAGAEAGRIPAPPLPGVRLKPRTRGGLPE